MDIYSSEHRSQLMARIHARNTSCELLMRKHLFSLGYRYRLHSKRLLGTPDIVLPKYKTVIFIHGCFWHGHSDCPIFREPKSNMTFWRKKILANSVRDAKVIGKLEMDGWKVIVVWECELRRKSVRDKTLAGIVNEIQDITSLPGDTM